MSKSDQELKRIRKLLERLVRHLTNVDEEPRFNMPVSHKFEVHDWPECGCGVTSGWYKRKPTHHVYLREIKQ